MALTPGLDAMLVSPGDPGAIYQSLGSSVAAIEPPVWAGMLAKSLEARGRGVRLIDQVGEGITTEKIAAEISELRPRLVGVVVYGQQPSASTQNMTSALALVAAIKSHSPRTRVILIGGHPSALPRETLAESAADFVCQGEGPLTLSALLAADDLSDASSLEKIPGLWYRDPATGTARFTQAAELVTEADLSSMLPGVAWHLLPMRSYRAHNWHCFENIDARQPYA